MQSSKIELPAPFENSPCSVERALGDRRTRREFSADALSLAEVSQLLWAGQGCTASGEPRNAPSAGAQYPASLFVIAGNVSGIDCGNYRYHTEGNVLEPVSAGDLRGPLAQAAIDPQPWLDSAAAIIVISMDIAAMNHHFRDQLPQGLRGERYAYAETGCISQNIHLQATAMNLGMVHVGGFIDEEVAAVVGLPEHLIPTAMLCLGR